MIILFRVWAVPMLARTSFPTANELLAIDGFVMIQDYTPFVLP
jgi:hypothetical protein